jgi:hypothetical protein
LVAQEKRIKNMKNADFTQEIEYQHTHTCPICKCKWDCYDPDCTDATVKECEECEAPGGMIESTEENILIEEAK